MAQLVIKKAVKFGAKLRMSLYGPSGSGKTYTALAIARELADEKRVCVIDTERGSASKYADVFDFDVLELDTFHPNAYIEAIRAIVAARAYDVLVIDSASHEWEGSRGALELAGRDFTNWATVTPLHNKFIDAMLAADIHVIATMRAKEEHVMEKEEGKKAVVRKMGMEPIQRKGMQYEFDIVCSLGMDNIMTVEKTRCSTIKDQIYHPGNEKTFTGLVQAWLSGEMPVRDPQTIVFPSTTTHQEPSTDSESMPITDQQLSSIRKLSEHLGKAEPENVESLNYGSAKELIAVLSQEYRQSRAKANSTPAAQSTATTSVLDFGTIYGEGAHKGLWNKQTFYKAASDILGEPVNADNVRSLAPAKLQKIADFVVSAEPVVATAK